MPRFGEGAPFKDELGKRFESCRTVRIAELTTFGGSSASHFSNFFARGYFTALYESNAI